MTLTKPDIYAFGFAILASVFLITQSDLLPEKVQPPEKRGPINLITCHSQNGQRHTQDYAYGDVTYRDGVWSYHSEMFDSRVQTNLACVVFAKMKEEQARSWNFSLMSPRYDFNGQTVDEHIAERTGEAPNAFIDPKTLAVIEEAARDASPAE